LVFGDKSAYGIKDQLQLFVTVAYLAWFQNTHLQ
jgi:hypothetical protein